MRGFDIRGIGPRVKRILYNLDGSFIEDDKDGVTDAIGGRAYYMGRIELEIPVSANIRSLGLRPAAFIDIGSVFKVKKPNLTNIGIICSPVFGSVGLETVILPPGSLCQGLAGPESSYDRSAGFTEVFLGNSAKPRLSVGVGVNWNSPFGPLRIDIAKALLKQEGDETKFFSFNVGTQF